MSLGLYAEAQTHKRARFNSQSRGFLNHTYKYDIDHNECRSLIHYQSRKWKCPLKWKHLKRTFDISKHQISWYMLVSSQGENSIFTASKLSILLLRSNEALLDIIIAHSRHSVAFGNWGKMSEQSWDQRDVKPLWIQSMKRTKKSYEIQKISKVTCKLLMILITLQETETYPTLGPWENHHPLKRAFLREGGYVSSQEG